MSSEKPLSMPNENHEVKRARGRPKILSSEEALKHKREAVNRYQKKLRDAHKLLLQIKGDKTIII